MAYHVYLGDTELPVPPEKIDLKISGNNKTLTLINDGEINLLKVPGLSDISFEMLLPQVQYPFAYYPDGFQQANYYLDILENLMVGRKPFQLIVSRTLPNGIPLHDTNMKVSLEEYSVTEDVQNGFDITVSVTLKQYRDYATKVIQVIENQANINSDRAGAPSYQSYTVVSGDTLWDIARRCLGNGTRWKEIYDLNADTIESAARSRGLGSSSTGHWIFPGTVLNIP